MATTQKHTNVWEAFAAAQAAFKSPAQSGNNPHFKSKYSTLGDIFAATMPALHEHGLVFTQLLDGVGESPALITQIRLPGCDDSITSEIRVPTGQNPQQFGSALSYMKRYSAAAMLGVVDGMDDDGEVVSGNGNGNQPPRRQQRKTAPEPQFMPEPEAEPADDGLYERERKRAHAIGTKLYGEGWEHARHMLVATITKGAEESVTKLNPAEMHKLVLVLVATEAAKEKLPDIWEEFMANAEAHLQAEIHDWTEPQFEQFHVWVNMKQKELLAAA